MILRVRRNFFEITTFPNKADVLPEPSLDTRLDRSSRDVIELNVC